MLQDIPNKAEFGEEITEQIYDDVNILPPIIAVLYPSNLDLLILPSSTLELIQADWSSNKKNFDFLPTAPYLCDNTFFGDLNSRVHRTFISA